MSLTGLERARRSKNYAIYAMMKAISSLLTEGSSMQYLTSKSWSCSWPWRISVILVKSRRDYIWPKYGLLWHCFGTDLAIRHTMPCLLSEFSILFRIASIHQTSPLHFSPLVPFSEMDFCPGTVFTSSGELNHSDVVSIVKWIILRQMTFGFLWIQN